MSTFLKHIVWGFLLLFLTVSNGQDTIQLDSTKLLKPYKKVELGASTHLNYFQGDLAHSEMPTDDIVNNLSYSFFFRKPVSKWIGLDYQFSLGKITVANGPETFPNLNFQSNILAHQVGLSISLRQLIYRDNYNPLVYPIIHLGAELMTFQSFGDITNGSGIAYNYWSDGTIRDIAEGAANAETASLMLRDNVYETDLRLMDNDGRGKYSQITYGFPLTFALKFRVVKQLHLSAYGTYHVIQSDLIDDVSAFGLNEREGDNLMDDYISAGFRLSYDFGATSLKDNEIKLKKKLANKRRKAAKKALKESRKEKEKKEEQPDLTQNKEINDEVGTQEEIELIEEEVALEEESKEEAQEETTSTYDSSNNSSSSTTDSYSSSNNSASSVSVGSGDYIVLIESYKGGVLVDEMNKLLKVKGVKTRKDANGQLNFEAGSFSKSDAETILSEVKGDGFSSAYIYTGEPQENEAKEMLGSRFSQSSSSYSKPNDEKVDMSGLVFKVQIAAYKNDVDNSKFSGVSNLSKEKTSTGVVRFFGGEFNDYQEALRRSSELDKKGYKGAFVVPYRNGKRISLSELDLGPSRKVEKLDESVSKKVEGDLVYRVQLGVFEKDVPFELLSKYLKVQGLDQTVDDRGYTTYYAGAFETYAEAKLAKEAILDLGIDGAFLIAFYKGDSISVSEALKLE